MLLSAAAVIAAAAGVSAAAAAATAAAVIAAAVIAASVFVLSEEYRALQNPLARALALAAPMFALVVHRDCKGQ